MLTSSLRREVARRLLSSSRKRSSSSGSSTVSPVQLDRYMALASVRPRMPSTPEATSGSPFMMCAAKARRTSTCCGLKPSVSTLIFSHLGVPKPFFQVLEKSCSNISSLYIYSSLFSTTSLPPSSVTSKRLVPGQSPVVVMNTPVAPLAYSTYAVTSSSTSMSCHLPSLQNARTLVGMPQIHCHRSRLCGHWFISTPPPSPDQVARHAPES